MPQSKNTKAKTDQSSGGTIQTSCSAPSSDVSSPPVEVTVEIAPAKYRIRVWQGDQLIEEYWERSSSRRNMKLAELGKDPNEIQDLKMA